MTMASHFSFGPVPARNDAKEDEIFSKGSISGLLLSPTRGAPSAFCCGRQGIGGRGKYGFYERPKFLQPRSVDGRCVRLTFEAMQEDTSLFTKHIHRPRIGETESARKKSPVG